MTLHELLEPEFTGEPPETSTVGAVAALGAISLGGLFAVTLFGVVEVWTKAPMWVDWWLT